ncbi:DUF6000 family protein [uncultured Chitinophaga sp.]|jgi:hypothetical protein|uniref:DUF6000 family protein n=1 Tax=uncultured Chitinophaga sp. TaxID=339340 RepID=UPI00260203DC|nr:DUF6000 family protein [uncultured Chitinophaga sp.]
MDDPNEMAQRHSAGATVTHASPFDNLTEVCCVGHIYALTLAFFNDANSIQYLNRYLDYYLTQPSLYFDQKEVMEAALFLDKLNNTTNFNTHSDKWKAFWEKRHTTEQRKALEMAKHIALKEGTEASNNYLQQLQQRWESQESLSTYFEEQTAILRNLHQHPL